MFRGVPKDFRNFVLQFEGEKLFRYKDPSGNDTIYIGHLCKPGEVYLNTEEDSAKYLALDAELAFNTVERLTDGEANDNEYMAMGDFAFNLGIGAFATSTLLKLFNKKDKAGAADEFLKWDKEHIDGQLVTIPGLTRRREAERELFLKAV